MLILNILSENKQEHKRKWNSTVQQKSFIQIQFQFLEKFFKQIYIIFKITMSNEYWLLLYFIKSKIICKAWK